MKWITPIAVLALGATLILAPATEAPEPGPAPGTVAPPLAVCATEEGGSRTSTIDVLSTVAGHGQLTLFSGGGSAGTGEFETGESGSARVPIADIAAVGRSAALVEFPDSESAAASIIRGQTMVAAEVCSRIPDRQVVVGGGSTIEDRIFQIQLMNPYSAEAAADITAFSESGRESSDALRSIVVPARSSVIVDVSSILPGRESLSLVVDVSRGSIVTSASLEVGPDLATWRAVAPEEIWYLPLPVYGGTREVVVAATTSEEVAYQIDVFGPNGLEEAAIEGTVGGGGQEAVDMSAISPAAIAVRVVASAPVGVFARLSDEGAIGIGSASPIAANDWLLPAAGFTTRTASTLVMVNVGVEPADVAVNELRDASRSRVYTMDPNQVLEVALDTEGSVGVSISSDSLVVPFWISRRLDAIAISGGYPITEQP